MSLEAITPRPIGVICSEFESFLSTFPTLLCYSHACGERIKKYGNRMDNVWDLRVAYAEAVKIVEAQNALCEKAENGLWDLINTPFPRDMKWESLVDVIRGRVKACVLPPRLHYESKLNLSQTGFCCLRGSC